MLAAIAAGSGKFYAYRAKSHVSGEYARSVSKTRPDAQNSLAGCGGKTGSYGSLLNFRVNMAATSSELAWIRSTGGGRGGGLHRALDRHSEAGVGRHDATEALDVEDHNPACYGSRFSSSVAVKSPWRRIVAHRYAGRSDLLRSYSEAQLVNSAGSRTVRPRDQALGWSQNQSMPVFGNKMAEQLVKDRRTAVVLRNLSSIQSRTPG